MTDEEKANIKYRLSDIGVKVGELALNYIENLEKENEELKYALSSSMTEQGFLENEIKNFKNGAEYKALADMVDSLQKENEELKKEISALLSCANCPENKGGYVCEREYNDKCLAQKIEHIKELKEEIAELKKQNSILKNDVRVAREDRERLQIEVGKGLKEFIHDCPYTALKFYASSRLVEENAELKEQIERMKNKQC